VDGVVCAAHEAIGRGRLPIGALTPPGWDGRAAVRIVDALCDASG